MLVSWNINCYSHRFIILVHQYGQHDNHHSEKSPYYRDSLHGWKKRLVHVFFHSKLHVTWLSNDSINKVILQENLYGNHCSETVASSPILQKNPALQPPCLKQDSHSLGWLHWINGFQWLAYYSLSSCMLRTTIEYLLSRQPWKA